MSGHGHVIPNADGSKKRCGGPAICSVCALEQAGQPRPVTGPAVTTDVRRCARCGQDHLNLRFTRMENPIDPEYPFWAACPAGQGPILLQALDLVE